MRRDDFGDADDDFGGDADDAGAELVTDAEVSCPWCGEVMTITLDPGGGALQEYEEDCQVCCRPWHVTVQFDHAGVPAVEIEPAS